MKFSEEGLHPIKCRQSAASCALRCERKWFLQYRMGVRLRGGYLKEAANLGSIYHRFQLEGPGDEAEARVLAWLRKKQQAIVKRIEAGDDIDGTLTRMANKLTELFDIARAMANVFWEKFPTPEWFVEITKEVKIEMALPLPWKNVVLSGTIDRLLLDTRTEFTWIRDHKSTGQTLDAIFAGAGWGLQGRIYRLLAEHWLVNEYDSPVNNVRGFVLDGIERPGIKLCRTDEKNAKEWNCSVRDAYLRRVVLWYKEHEGEGDAAALRSRAVLYTESRYPAEIVEVLDRFQCYAERPDVHPESYSRDVTRSECFNYTKVCPYCDLCNMVPKNWDELFEKKYKQVTVGEAEDEF